MAVSDYPNGKAPKSALILVEDMWVDPDVMAPRVRYIADYCRSRGVRFNGTQGYRWLGVPDDRAIGRLDPSEGQTARTSDGTGNQWYQVGREDAGYTPSAAHPVFVNGQWQGTSNHGRGLSIDTNVNGPNSLAVRDNALADVGMRRDISSETWHGTIVGAPRVDLTPWMGDTGANRVAVPQPKDQESGMIAIRGPQGTFALDTEYVHWLGTDFDTELIAGLTSNPDELHELQDAHQLDVAFAAYGIPPQYTSPDEILAFNPQGFWSRQLEIAKKLGL